MNLKRLLVLATCAIVTSNAFSAPILDGLTDKQIATIKKGGLAVKPTEIPGSPWPKLQVFTQINAPVSEVEKVFRDYKNAASYSPGVDSVDVLAHPSKNVYDVRYNSSLPLIGDTSNTVRNTFSYEGKDLVVKWHLLKSSVADISEGELRAAPYGSGCILRYTNYVKPKSKLAGLARGAALGEVKKTVVALKGETEKRYQQKN